MRCHGHAIFCRWVSKFLFGLNTVQIGDFHIDVMVMSIRFFKCRAIIVARRFCSNVHVTMFVFIALGQSFLQFLHSFHLHFELPPSFVQAHVLFSRGRRRKRRLLLSPRLQSLHSWRTILLEHRSRRRRSSKSSSSFCFDALALVHAGAHFCFLLFDTLLTRPALLSLLDPSSNVGFRSQGRDRTIYFETDTVTLLVLSDRRELALVTNDPVAWPE